MSTSAFLAPLILSLCASVAPAQTLDETAKTAQMSNGRKWLSMEVTEKSWYLTAYLDLTVHSVLQIAGDKDSGQAAQYANDHWANKAVVGDYLRELDTLYKDGENAGLPIPMAFEYCTQKLRGNLTKAELEQILIGLRGKAAKW